MNSITIQGQVHRAEIKQAGEVELLSFSLKDRQYVGEGKGYDGGKYKIFFYECALFGKRARSAQKLIREGSEVTVTGQLRPRQYQKKDGSTGMSMDVRVNDFGVAFGDDARAPTADNREPVYKASTSPGEIFGDAGLPF